MQECNAAGYYAIEYKQVGTEVGANGHPIDGSGYLAPVVLADKCVGCGLCQTRCHGINVKEKGLLAESAIIIEAGEGKEDRLMAGSYLELREQERQQAKTQHKKNASDYFVPGSTPNAEEPSTPADFLETDDPFGTL